MENKFTNPRNISNKVHPMSANILTTSQTTELTLSENGNILSTRYFNDFNSCLNFVESLNVSQVQFEELNI